LKKICVFCGSAQGNNPAYKQAAIALGQVLSENGVALVYGGARIGLMGVIADTVMQNGGEVIGVIPKDLVDREVAHHGLTKLHVVASMHERKALMAELADGFVALPGGFGTWEEIIEVLTWAQLGLHQKPCALLNTADYYQPLLNMVDHGLAEGFLTQIHKKLLLSSKDPGDLLRQMSAYKCPSDGSLFAHLKDKI